MRPQLFYYKPNKRHCKERKLEENIPHYPRDKILKRKIEHPYCKSNFFGIKSRKIVSLFRTQYKTSPLNRAFLNLAMKI